MIVKLVAALLFAGHLSLSNSQESSPPAVPQSLDNFGGDVSDFSIMYTNNLQGVMRKFSITKAEMEEMLRMYVAGGQPKITKTVFNPDTKLNETITLDFKSFEEDSSAGMQSDGASQDNVEVVFRPPNQRGSSSGTPRSITRLPSVRSTGLPSIDDLRGPISAVEDPMNPSPSMDLTAMRENEASLIEDLKLLQRRRDALEKSYTQNEIDEETYRLNVETNELQMRDAYSVLQQIQDAIREFLGIPPQRPSVAANTLGDNLLGAPQSTDLIPDRPLTNQKVATGGEPLSPAEELALIRQELDRLRTGDAGKQNDLHRLRMRTDGNSISDTTNAASNGFVQTIPDGAFGSMVDLNLPSPAPAPAVSGFSSGASSILPPSEPGTNFPNIRSGTSPSSEAGVRNYMNHLINEYIRLNRRETEILGILDDSNTQQLIGNSAIQLQNRPIDTPKARQNTERTVTRSSQRDSFHDPISANILDKNLRFNTMDDNNRIDRNEPLDRAMLPSDNQLINNLLSEYNKLNQRESEIQGVLNNQLDQNAIVRNDLFDRNQPKSRIDSGRSVDLSESSQNIASLPVDRDLSRDFQTFQTENLLDQTLRARPDGLGGTPSDQFLRPNFRQFDTTLDENVRQDARRLERTFDQPLRPDARARPDGLGGTPSDQFLRPYFRQFDTTLDENIRQDARRLERTFDQPFRPDARARPDGLGGTPSDQFLRPNLRHFDTTLDQIVRQDARQFDRTFDQTARPDIGQFDRMLNENVRQDTRRLKRPDAREFDRMLDQTLRPNARMLGGSLRPDNRPLDGMNDLSLIWKNFLPLSTEMSGPLSRASDRSGLFSNERTLDRSAIVSGASNFADIRSNTIQDARPTPLTGSALDRSNDELLVSSRTDSTDNNLVYNDGTITIESVRPAGTYDEGDPATPLETGQVSEFPVSGFSSRASGLLTPRLDSLTLMNRIDPRLGRRRGTRRRSLYPFIGNRMLQQRRKRRGPVRRTLF